MNNNVRRSQASLTTTTINSTHVGKYAFDGFDAQDDGSIVLNTKSNKTCLRGCKEKHGHTKGEKT